VYIIYIYVYIYIYMYIYIYIYIYIYVYVYIYIKRPSRTPAGSLFEEKEEVKGLIPSLLLSVLLRVNPNPRG